MRKHFYASIAAFAAFASFAAFVPLAAETSSDDGKVTSGFLLQEYRKSYDKLQEAMGKEPKVVTPPVTPEEIQKDDEEIKKIEEQRQAEPDNKELQDQWQAKVDAKYGKARKLLETEVQNVKQQAGYYGDVIPRMDDCLARVPQLKEFLARHGASAEDRKTCRQVAISQLGAVARFAAQLKDRNPEGYQRIKDKALRAKDRLESSLWQGQDLASIIGEHNAYVADLRETMVQELWDWLAIAQELMLFVDDLELKEIIEKFLSGFDGKDIPAIRKELKHRRTGVQSRLAKLRNVLSPLRTTPAKGTADSRDAEFEELKGFGI